MQVTTLEPTVKNAIPAIMQAVVSQMESGDYTVSLELDGALTYLTFEGSYRFNYFNKGVQILSGIEPLFVSDKAFELLERRIKREFEAIERLKYDALRVKFESLAELKINQAELELELA